MQQLEKVPAPILKWSASREAGKAARAVIPGGVNSNFRKDTTFQPVFITSGAGARLTDIDGNEYIDYALSYGPAILGHNNAHFREALHRQLDQLYSPETSLLEQRAAEKIVRHVPCAEQVRFNSTGSEANYNALRIARAHTGRALVVRFSGHYHGGTDELLGGVRPLPFSSVAQPGEYSDDLFSQATNTRGRAPGTLDNIRLLEWNDTSGAQALFAREGQDIAAVLMEPVMLNNGGIPATADFAATLRQLCNDHGSVLIFDEVVTGFRAGLGGMQSKLGVTPDLATFAKALGNGMPVSAICGRRAIMETVSRAETVVGGTYNGHPLCMAAIIATIEELERDDGAAFRRMEQLGHRFREGLEDIAARLRLPIRVSGLPAAWIVTFQDGPTPQSHEDTRGYSAMRSALFNAELRRRGVLATVRFCTSAAHELRDVEDALNRAEDSMKEVARIG